MNKEIRKGIVKITEDEIDIPKMINRKSVREELKIDFAQIPEETIDFIDVVVYSLTKYISKRAKSVHGNGRLTPDKVKDILWLDDVINMNYGNINITHEDSRASEERIAQKVLSILALNGIQNRKIDKLDVDYEKILEEEELEENE